jgi:hypothetical protein
MTGWADGRTRRRVAVYVTVANMLLGGWLVGCGAGNDAASTPTPKPTVSTTPGVLACPTHVELHIDGPHVDLDFGFTGVTYDTPFHDGIVLTLAATCAESAQGACTSCRLTGPATHAGQRATRRCADDIRRVCAADADCTTGMCTDLLGPPLGLIGGGSATCVRNEITDVGSGTLDPATGALTVPVSLRWTFIEGLDVGVACPVCTGAGLADTGLCHGGPHNGETCIVDATDATLGNTSYDCSPGLSAAIGVLNFSIQLTTGTSRLEATQACLGTPAARCYCAGQMAANTCLGSLCEGEPGEDAVCVDGPIDATCEHDAFRGCFDDRDCPASSDHCRMHPRECSAEANAVDGNVEALERTGIVDPVHATLVGTSCVPAANNATSNVGLGLPGPVAVRMPVTVVRTK